MSCSHYQKIYLIFFSLSLVSIFFPFCHNLSTPLHWQCRIGEWSRTRHTLPRHLWSIRGCSRCQARYCSRTSHAARSYDTSVTLQTVYSDTKKVRMPSFCLQFGTKGILAWHNFVPGVVGSNVFEWKCGRFICLFLLGKIMILDSVVIIQDCGSVLL